MDLVRAAAILGSLLAASVALRVLDFLWFYVLRPSSLGRYRQGQNDSDVTAQPWALITGSSDGIGKGFAEELCSRGFNIILHGRNADKLAKVRTELLQQWPKMHVRLAILDAREFTDDGMNALVDELKGLNISVLINNVGGAPPMKTTFRPFETLQPEEIDGFISMNARFPTLLTAKLLPQLRRRGPALIINLGSFAGVEPPAYLSVYAASKGFNHAWGKCLHYEMAAEGHDVEVLTLVVAEVQNQWDRGPTHFLRPSARHFAKSALHKVGCGRGVIVPHLGHALQTASLGALPNVMKKPIMVQIGKVFLRKEQGLIAKQQ